MRKIRIGNDIQVSWEVRTGGEALSLEGRALRVWVRSAYSKQEVESFQVEGCVVTFTYPAEMQKTTGARAVVLEDITEGSARRTLCADEAFTLVAHSSEEDYGGCACGCNGDTEEDFAKYLVSLKSNVLVGKPGLSAYDLWLADGHTGTMADYMKWLQQPAADVASSVMEAEEKRVEAENGRAEAERLRDEAETERATNETQRDKAETERATAEEERQTAFSEAVDKITETESSVKQAEALRADEEAKRAAAEAGRTDAEAKRQAAESERQTAETLRKDAETTRNTAESARIAKESARIADENERTASESDRQTAEQSRAAAEQSRQTAEQSRAKAETDRNEAERLRTDAEQKRAAAEQERGDTFRQQTETIDTALKNCETATEGAEKVNVVLSDANVLTVTDRDGQAKSVDLASQEDVAGIVDDVRHLNETMGAYTERESITLAAVEQNKAVSADGVKVSKSGWAIAEFTAEKGNVYLFKPGVTDGSVCIFAEKITSVETRGIDYTYTYNEDGTIATATATYLGKTHAYTYTWGTDAQGNKTATITENGAEVAALPMTYETQVGTYAPLVRLNADAELPKDGYCRYMSHFKGNSAIKIAVSYKVGSADLVMKVTRDGVLASISTQLGNLSQKEDETRSKVEEYHRSYAELLFKEDWTITVDNKKVTIPGRVKTKVYPLRQMAMGSVFMGGDTISKVPLLWADVSHLDTSNFTTMSSMFMGCTGVTSLDVSGWDTSKVTNMSSMFRDCTGVTSLDVSGWDTSKVTNMSSMFRDCTGITSLDVSGWDTSKVTNMNDIFMGCTGITSLDVSGWDTSKVTTMSSMFRGCTGITSLDVSGWDTSKVTNMNNMFVNLQSIKKIAGLSTLVKAACQYLPSFSSNLPAIDLDLSGWDTSGVKQISLLCYMSAIKRLDASGDGWVFPNLTQAYRPFAGVNAGVVLGKNFFNMPQITQFDFGDVHGWQKADVVLSLVTNSYDRRANGLNDLTIGLRDDQKKQLTEDDIATMTAKGYIIA